MNLAAALTDLASDASRLRDLLTAPYRDELGELERRLGAEHGPVPIGRLCADLFASGGKRLRGLMALIVAAAEGVGREAGLALAEAAELTHGATLLHDDVIDEADTRRGQVAARRQWSNTLSVLGGDYLLLRAIEGVAALGSPDLAAAHRRTIDRLLAAEVAQHLSRRDQDIGTEGYLAVAEGKTAALFAFAAASPALLAGDAAAAAELERFGIGLGVAFQIADDLRDVLGRDLTKPAALDLQDGVLSLPLRLAAQADAALARDLRAGLGRRLGAAEVRDLIARIVATPAREGCLALAAQHLSASGAALAALQLPEAAAPLAGVHAWLTAELRGLEDA